MNRRLMLLRSLATVVFLLGLAGTVLAQQGVERFTVDPDPRPNILCPEVTVDELFNFVVRGDVIKHLDGRITASYDGETYFDHFAVNFLPSEDFAEAGVSFHNIISGVGPIVQRIGLRDFNFEVIAGHSYVDPGLNQAYQDVFGTPFTFDVLVGSWAYFKYSP